MFRIFTYSADHLPKQGERIDRELAASLDFVGFDHNEPLEGHMASDVAFLMSDERKWK